jgi:MFS family permease
VEHESSVWARSTAEPARGAMERDDDTRKTRAPLLLVFLVVAAVYVVSPVITNYDSYPAFPTAVSIVNRRTLSLDAYHRTPPVTTNYGVTDVHGHLLTAFPWPVALFAVPSVVALDIGHLFGGPSPDAVVAAHGRVESLSQMWSASLVTALAVTMLALVAYRRLGGTARTRRRLSFVCAIVVAFATSAWSVASRALWQHGPSLLLLSTALVAVDRIFPRVDAHTRLSPHRASFVAGASLMAAIAVRPTNGVVLATIGVLVLWRATSLVRAYVLGALIVAVPWIAITRVSYGSLLQPYDKVDRLGWQKSFPEAVAANLFSPSRGLLVFSPVVLLAVAGVVIAIRNSTFGPMEVACAVVVPLYLVAVSLFPVWWAGSTFGPRYMTETLPFLFVLALPCVDRLREWHQAPSRRPRLYVAALIVVACAVAASMFVHGQGGLLRATTCWNGKVGSPEYVDQPSRVWSWSDGQFDYGIRHVLSDGLRSAVRGCPWS